MTLETLLKNHLFCPYCRKPKLKASRDLSEIYCRKCRKHFPLVEGVPIFHEMGEKVPIAPKDHQSNPIAANALELLENAESLALNIGAGASASKIPNVIEFEYQVFSTTDVAGDAHRLPFRDNTFDVVCAMNVFEHLYAPHIAASEIHRVLKPGGQVLIHTAFLQPLHEPPHHYYNATEFGVRKWFEQFDVAHCKVSDNFTPAYALGMICTTLNHHMEGIDPETTQLIRDSTVGDWLDFWAGKTKDDPEAITTKISAKMLEMDQNVLAMCAAGFELLAKK